MSVTIHSGFPVLGMPAMDESHHRLADELNAIGLVRDQEFVEWYPPLVAAIERDFREEELLMEVVGVESFQAHVEQHARMLSALHHAAPRVQAGEVALGRQVVAELAEWLRFHIASMD
ncbi:hypothetical protein E4K72_22645 [Oxalobacteraceae bacterium OM1]|nr:hypothetical protein E4K72_22645 [Oxalobacteraceae bacterium OM1]